MAVSDVKITANTEQAKALESAVRQLRAAYGNLYFVVHQMNAQTDNGTPNYARLNTELGLVLGGTQLTESDTAQAQAFYNTVNNAKVGMESGAIFNLIKNIII